MDLSNGSVFKIKKKILTRLALMLMRLGQTYLAEKLVWAINLWSPVPKTSRLVRVSSVASFAKNLVVDSLLLTPSRVVDLGAMGASTGASLPVELNGQESEVVLPPIEVHKFQDISIIGGTEALLVNDNEILYDEIALGDVGRYGCKAMDIIFSQTKRLYLPAFYKSKVILSYSNSGHIIDRAIHLCKDHSINYYHWLFECLPRAILASNVPDYKDLPILVDENIPPQHVEALFHVCGKRELVKVPRGHALKVRELVFPCIFSLTHDNHGNKVQASDFVIAPEAVGMVRHACTPLNHVSSSRKLYISRDKARYRKLNNERVIQDALLGLGFEIVRPEEMTFSEQLAIFSQAETIIGPTGAGLSNMLFAPSGCKVIVLAGETNGANNFIFSQLGKILDHNLKYLTGPARYPRYLHSDYVVELNVLLEMLSE